MTAIVLILFIAFAVVILRTQPAKADVTITAMRYTLDDVLWIGLDGATLDPGYINVSVTWKNNSSESVDTIMTLEVEDQDQEPDMEYATLAPNEDATAALLMEFTEGERKVTAIVYEEETMKELGRMTVSVSVIEEVGPAEFVLSDLVITPSAIQLGEQVSTGVTITNVGATGGDCTVTLERTGRTPHEQNFTIAAGQQANFNLTWEPREAGTVTIKFTGPTNSLSGTFGVTTLPPPAEAKGTILAIMAEVRGDWQNLDGLTIALNQTVPLAVSWKSDMSSGDPSIRGHVVLKVTKPSGQSVNLTATSGQDSIVAPGESGEVRFSVTFSQAGTWNFEAILSGEIV